MQTHKCKFVIIGAGISGLSTGYELSKVYKEEVIILERESTIGGLCRSLKSEGGSYDLGSHRIHWGISKTVLSVIEDICGGMLIKNIRQGKLRIKNRYVSYPLVLHQFVMSIGLVESFLCCCSLLREVYNKFTQKNSDFEINYESHIIKKAGIRAYKLFYEPYAKKVWGVDPKTISIDAVKKRVSMSNPLRILREIVRRPSNDQGKNFYYYLREGIGSLTDGLGSKIIANGGKLITGVSDFKIDDSSNRQAIYYYINGKEHRIEFETLISTIPIDDLISKLFPKANLVSQEESLRWRGLRLVFLHLHGKPNIEGETFYFPELEYVFGRVSIPERFSEKMQPDNNSTCFTCEVPCSEGDNLWTMSDVEIYELCLEDLQKAGLVNAEEKYVLNKCFTVNLKKVYPLYTVGWRNTLRTFFNRLSDESPHVYASGRPGFFMHCNLDHSMEMGMELAKCIIENKTPEEWYAKFELFHGMKLRD